jgi:arylsulfatase A-like enzyme
MGVKALQGYGRFTGQVLGAACLGGVLAAAGELILGAALGRGALWGPPRLFFQVLFSCEALWAAAVSGLVFAAGCSIYYFRAARRGRVRLNSPALLIAVIALSGVPFFYLLATVDFTWFYYKPNAVILAVFLLTVAAWFCAGWGVYGLLNKIRRRSSAGGPLPVNFLRLLTLGLLTPFIVAEAWAIWREREPPPGRPDIYLVVMDAFRADRLSYYGGERYLAPTLEMFGVEAVVFKEAFTVSSWTKPVVVSIFTATYPGTHAVDANFLPLPDDAVTLAETLREGGYRTICVSANPHVTRPARMGDGFDIMDDIRQGPVFNGAGPPASCARPSIALLWMRPFLGPLLNATNDGLSINARLKFWNRFARGRPAFYYVHYMEPHIPNLPGPEYLYEYQAYLTKVDQARRLEIAAGAFFWYDVLKDPAFVPDFNDDELGLARALYDAEIRRMDVVVEDLLENVVTRSGSDPEPVIVITADHGEEFLEHGRWLHGAGLHHEVARVPFIIKAPGCKPGVVGGPVNVVDIPPTLVSFAGLERPRDWEGLDLSPYIKSGSEVPPRELLLEGIHTIRMPSDEEGGESSIELNALVAGDYYYLKDENAGVEYLYDRRHDRWQKNNLASDAAFTEAGGVLAECRDALARAKSRVKERRFAQGEILLLPAFKKELRTLGYVR